MASLASMMVSRTRAMFVNLMELVAVALVCLPFVPCLIYGSRLSERRFRRREAARPPPPPLPAARIDIWQRPWTEQSQSSRLLSLPLELRRCIYDHALGGRLVKLHIAASKYHKHYVIFSTCYEPVEDPDRILRLLIQPPADAIPVALLLSCRQIYLEALPILHQRNTFYFLAHEFHTAVVAALGRYCLPNLRSVYLRHDSGITALGSSRPIHQYDSQWPAMFALLRQMRLESLVFELDPDVAIDAAEPYPHCTVLDTAWARGLLSVRGLRRFTLLFARGGLPMLPGFNDSLLEQLRALLTDEKADEQYASFLAGNLPWQRRVETTAPPEAAAGRDSASGHDA
ncbi:hypothetical protein K438DRAFT_1810816 [Mycena galopus ATCC 62051]|nr:hypothetical protein K438DRAFT_1810816 [Mycena galopus ATCC 62051]